MGQLGHPGRQRHEPSTRASSRYNHNIVIEDNTFRVFDPRILNIYSVHGLTFRKNTIATSTDYPAIHKDAKPFEVTFSDHIMIDAAPVSTVEKFRGSRRCP